MQHIQTYESPGKVFFNYVELVRIKRYFQSSEENSVTDDSVEEHDFKNQTAVLVREEFGQQSFGTRRKYNHNFRSKKIQSENNWVREEFSFSYYIFQ